ncbi:MAG TPA: hypothetical protein VHQ65_15860 [Thermoanaerobaculia bacterium]|nr:hypothetical protein [Thermoanaerobaculia bacterium]
MAPLAAALGMLGLVALFLRHAARSGARKGAQKGALGLAMAVAVLPLLYGAGTLWSARGRLEALHLTYVGKSLAWGEGVPLVAGGAGSEGGGGGDLTAPHVAAGAVRIEPAPADAEGSGPAPEGAPGPDPETPEIAPGSPVLRLAAPLPVVQVFAPGEDADGRIVNSVPLAEGDRLRLEGGGAPLELVLRDGELVRERDAASEGGGDAEPYPLPGWFERLLRPGRVVYLPDVLAAAAPEAAAGWGARVRSLLVRRDGAWHLVQRDAGVVAVRDGAVRTSLDAPHPLPERFDLQLSVVWSGAGNRRLRTVRRDEVVLGGERAEVRFGEPQRRVVPLDEVAAPLEIGLVVPSAADRRPELIELDEDSPRFHGVSGTLRYDPAGDVASLQYLGARWEMEHGELYALGEGDDLMLLRLERGGVPGRVLADLALLSLYLLVFLVPLMRGSPTLAAVVAPVGLLLADRLLFAHRAAIEPPHYLLRAYAEARVALWLVPALLLFGWTLGILLQRVDGGPGDAWRDRLRAGAGVLRWPTGGLLVAAAGCLATVWGAGSLALLALLPLGLAALLLAAYAWGAGPGAAAVTRWREGGWPWHPWALVAVGAGLLALRGGAVLLGMPEALRLPAVELRVLWTFVHLPVAVVAVGLTAHWIEERRRRAEAAATAGVEPGAEAGSTLAADWARGVIAFGLFLVLAFAVVAAVVDDLGLLIVHGLPAVFALALLAVWPWARSRWPVALRPRMIYAATLVAALVPLLVVVAVNRWPKQLTALAAGATEDSGTPEQRLFRLQMLANPEALPQVGLKPAEQVAIQYHTVRNYGEHAGWVGDGYASSELPRHLGVTYLNDLMPMAFVLAEFGKLGMLGLALTYLAVLLAAWPALSPGGGRWGRQGGWVATLALLAFALPGLYMILANLNQVLFTGKNCSLLALNSVSDVLEAGALLALAAFGLVLREGEPVRPSR